MEEAVELANYLPLSFKTPISFAARSICSYSERPRTTPVRHLFRTQKPIRLVQQWCTKRLPHCPRDLGSPEIP
jgi:hypothetical protein